MLKKTIKLRWRRLTRYRRRQVEDMGEAADEQLERHFFRRLGRLVDVRRFIIGWVTLVALLAVALFLQADSLRDKYQTLQPVSGGTFAEGIVGKYSNANPLYATSAPDVAVSRLIFAGLFNYDGDGQLTPQLAENIQVDQTELIYTLTLKPDLVWHDGQPLTSEDVVFTYQMIQNPDARSYLQSSWSGVKIEAKDDRTVVFTLPDRLSGFMNSLTNGLIPKHILEAVNPEQLRSSDFNTIQPIGAGPFKFEAIELETAVGEDQQQHESIGLVAFENYALGKPQLNRFVIRTFAELEALERAYDQKEVTAMAGLPTVPDGLNTNLDVRDISLPLSGQVMVFFKTSSRPLDTSEVRRALTLGADRGQIISSIGYPLLVSDSPLLKSHIGYNSNLVQKTNSQKAAKKLLDVAGWKVDPSDGIRKKKKQALSFRLYSEANSEYASVTQSLQKQWREIGVDVQVSLQSAQDLQNTISTHNYDALLYAISTGADPDVYAYWHSSQADARSSSRLNFSEYRSPTADIAIEGGRSRSDPRIRQAKYEPFLEAWSRDNPALALYQPRYLYIVREPFYGFDLNNLVNPVDRFSGVEHWMIREERR